MFERNTVVGEKAQSGVVQLGSQSDPEYQGSHREAVTDAELVLRLVTSVLIEGMTKRQG